MGHCGIWPTEYSTEEDRRLRGRSGPLSQGDTRGWRQDTNRHPPPPLTQVSVITNTPVQLLLSKVGPLPESASPGHHLVDHRPPTARSDRPSSWYRLAVMSRYPPTVPLLGALALGHQDEAIVEEGVQHLEIGAGHRIL